MERVHRNRLDVHRQSIVDDLEVIAISDVLVHRGVFSQDQIASILLEVIGEIHFKLSDRNCGIFYKHVCIYLSFVQNDDKKIVRLRDKESINSYKPFVLHQNWGLKGQSTFNSFRTHTYL